jgi:hypothetical protein
MIALQLYIEGEQVELHDDESVVLNQSIQDVRDIKKVFTDFTRTFNVPASKTNNKIFKHYYNFDISGFDARNKKNASLYLNYKTFKTGKIKLEGVQLKNNKPVNYRLTFYGNTIELKDILSEDKLANLDVFETVKLTYSGSQILTDMQSGKTVNIDSDEMDDAIIYPLITHTDRLYYDSGEDTADTFNLHVGSANKGLVATQLKPAIRVYTILKAITNKYGIKFSTDFFNKTNDKFYKLYLWLHRKKGSVFDDELPEYRYGINNFEARGGSTLVQDFNRYTFLNRRDKTRFISVKVDTGAGIDYKLVIKEDQNVFFEGEFTGDSTPIAISDQKQLTRPNNTVRHGIRVSFSIITSAQATFNVTVRIADINDSYNPVTAKGSVTTTNYSVSNQQISVQQEMPNIKIIDFLTGLFKLYNLTAFYENDTIKVLPLDDYYASSTQSHDVTEFLDKSTSEVNTVMPYKNIDFKYAGTDSFFADNHNKANTIDWGSLTYSNNGVSEGKTYKIELPFEHHKFERLKDVSGSYTTVQWGWSVDSKQEEYIGKPLLFYGHKVTDGTSIGVQQLSGGSATSIDDYYIPSNQVDPTQESQSINFGSQVSEYTRTSVDASIFNTYYKTYILDTFNLRRRISKFKAYLPMNIISQLKLQDKIQIFNSLYKINTISTNFQNGVTNLELVNEVSDFTLPFGTFDDALPVEVSDDTITADTITIRASNSVERL